MQPLVAKVFGSSKAVICFGYSLFIVALCVGSVFIPYFVMQCLESFSSFTIIWMRTRELVALLLLYF